jgi:DNA-directed RNA polymerase subunit F
MFIQRGTDTSGGISPGSNIIEHRLFISELQNKNKIQRVISDADYYVQKFDDAFSRCLDSFKYKEEATKIIDSILPRLNELMTSILRYSKIIVKHEDYWNNFHVRGKSKTGTIIDLFSINYTNPVADESVLLSEAENALKRYKIEYDKNQARKAAKQAELAANPNTKIITRKEVTQAINASGVNVRTDFVYTNKHKTITTYKYAFNNLTQGECDKIKDELIKIGANVKNVTCEQGWWSGRGAYMSLFVRLYN